MTFSINKSKLANALLVAFIICVFAGKMLQIALLYYTAIAMAFVALSIGDNSFRVGFCLFLLPSVRLFDGLQVSFLVNLLMAFPVLAYFLETRRINVTALGHVLILAVWELAHMLYFNNMSSAPANFGSIIILYYVECVLVNQDIYLDFSEIARKFSLGGIFSGALYLIYNTKYYDFSTYFNTRRLAAYAGDPNYYALYLSLAITMLFLIKGRHKKRDYIYMFLLIGMELLTSSKMALIILILLLVYTIGKSLRTFLSRKNRFIRRIVFIGLALGALFSNQIATLIQSTIIRTQEYRGTAVNIDTITSNRIMIQGFYLNEIVTNVPLLVFGFGLQYNETPAYLDFFYISHNTFMDLILSWGLIGVVMMTFIFYQILTKMRLARTERLTFDNYLTLIVTGVSFFALSCLSASMFWWIMCAALLPLKGIQEDAKAAYISDHSRVQRRKISFKMRRVA